MAGRYTITVSQQTGATTAPARVLALGGAANVRPRVYEVLASCSASPGDNTIGWKMARVSGTIAGTLLMPPPPSPLDFNDPATKVPVWSPFTSNPGTASLLEFWVNQRAIFRWVAAPGGEIVVPALTTEGIGFTAGSTLTTGLTTSLSVYWIE